MMKPLWWVYNAKTEAGRYTEHPRLYEMPGMDDWTVEPVVVTQSEQEIQP